MKSSKELT